MLKYCILQADKLCDNCGECNTCDLNPSKICDSCGKCLRLEGYDSKAIGIEEIVEENEQVEDIEESIDTYDKDKAELLEKHANYNANLDNDDVKIEYIDDIDGLSDILEEDETKEQQSIKEIFPGLFVVDKDDK